MQIRFEDNTSRAAGPRHFVRATANDRWVSNFDQFFVGLPINVFELDGGRRFVTQWTFSGKLTGRKCLVA